ncbi:hypothetical protein F442_04713 [Phytophthora nicotianae P10297]|uniref:Uncharacterized protein n=1 Tax=Phytophthora nicotianae P10297 TaxID=1317064 RepID=W2ZRD6_PHYNI|nr:hypothetical protein F442_04713 [Phytophthora nicotianae P10297]
MRKGLPTNLASPHQPAIYPPDQCAAMFTQPALASSAFAGFSDELIAYFTLFCEPKELLRLSEEDPLWMGQCLRLHNGDFSYHYN